jgi:transketolase
MYIAEQNMVGAALGLSARGKIPFVSTFAAFFTRAHDQIRMCQYSRADVKFCGSHAGVSIGEDGPSQMGLEDIALFRGLIGAAVLYPSDAVAMEKLVAEAARRPGIVYLRSTRAKTPVLYKRDEEFPIGGNKVLRESEDDAVAIVAAGIAVVEALKAWETLKDEGIRARVIDQYTIKPIDAALFAESIGPVRSIVTVEDHHPEGGLGDAVAGATRVPVTRLAVRHLPRSGSPMDLMEFEDISARAIVETVTQAVSGKRRGRPRGLNTRIFPNTGFLGRSDDQSHARGQEPGSEAEARERREIQRGRASRALSGYRH